MAPLIDRFSLQSAPGQGTGRKKGHVKDGSANFWEGRRQVLGGCGSFFRPHVDGFHNVKSGNVMLTESKRDFKKG